MKREFLFLVVSMMLLLAVDSYALSITFVSGQRRVESDVEANAGPVSNSDYDFGYSNGIGNFNYSVESSASANYTPSICGGFICIPGLPLMSSATASASQNTNILFGTDTLTITGNMDTYEHTSIGFTGGGPASAQAMSYLYLTYNIDSAAQYEFTFTDNTYYSAGHLTMQNLDTSAWVLYGTDYPWSGTIGAGNYQFKFWMDGNNYFGSHSNADFSFEVTAGTFNSIPEPSTMLLLGSGLLGLVALRREVKR